MDNDPINDLMTITEAAAHSKVSRQAIYVALRDKRLKGIQHKHKWFVSRKDLDFYRANKHIGDHRKRNGERIFDLEKGIYSVHQVSKFMSVELGRPYTMNRIYFLLTRGRIKASRIGAAWVITKEELVKLLELEQGRERERAKKYG